MIEFKKLIVRSFYSLGEAELLIKNGVYLIYGYNKDVVSEVNTSNGAGKTSLFNAIYQGLFNKNLKDPKGQIDSVSNLFLGEPYYIEIHFIKNGNKYKVINDRKKGRILIYKNDVNISLKGIHQNLSLIKDIIGFDFQTFTALTFLNQNVLDSIIDTTSKNNILYQFFELDRLKGLEKYIKNRVKDFKNKRILLMEKEQEYINYLAIINSTSSKNYEEELFLLKQELNDLENSKLKKDLVFLKEKIDKINEEIDKYNIEYRELSSKIDYIDTMLKKIKLGICPVCGQKTDKIAPNYLKDKEDLLNKRNKVVIKRDKLKEKLDDITGNYELLLKSYKEKKTELENEIRIVERELVKKSNRESIYGELEKNKEIYNKKLEEVRKDLKKVDIYLNTYSKILELISKGYITEVYLKSFIELLRENTKYFLNKTDFNFKINISIKKGALYYTFLEDGVEKTFGQLSSGEKTRVSLILLLANIKALEQLIGVEINFLVFDELLGVLDEEGLEFIKTVINEFKTKKAIFIITHHDEITSTYADYILNVIKEKNIARIEIKEKGLL